MKCLLIFIFIAFSYSSWSQNTGIDSNVVYKVHCDCEHIAATIPGNEKRDVEDQCMSITRELMEQDLGGVSITCESGGCRCIFSHSTYGFGTNRNSAIENAKLTCSAVSESTNKDFIITSPEKCKDEN